MKSWDIELLAKCQKEKTMAIKIIKNTMKDPIEHECSNCKSIFSYNFQDIQSEKVMSILGFNTYERYLICPVCKEKETLHRASCTRELEAGQVLSDEGKTDE